MKTIASVLQPFVDRNVLAGAVTIVATKDKVLSWDAVGYTDVVAKTPMRQDSYFWIASNSKPITAAAFMMLVDEGKIDLDHPVQKYLPLFADMQVVVEQNDDHIKLRKAKSPIKVRQLLSHTGGLPAETKLHWRLDAYPMKESAIAYAMLPLNSEPGTKYEYSNPSILTAGRIMEVVSGMEFADFVDQRLLQPLGMTETTCWPSASQLARLAKPYTTNEAKTDFLETKINYFSYPLDNPKRHASPGGGYFSTAGDLLRFAQMIANEGVFEGKRYLSVAAVKEMTTRQTGTLEANYALGWGTAPPAGFGHGGALGNHLWINPENGIITIFLIQHAGFPGPDQNPKISTAFTDAANEIYGKR